MIVPTGSPASGNVGSASIWIMLDGLMRSGRVRRGERILCIVPDQRKAEAVRAALEGPVTTMVPASILQTHPDVTLFLDRGSASLLARP